MHIFCVQFFVPERDDPDGGGANLDGNENENASDSRIPILRIPTTNMDQLTGI